MATQPRASTRFTTTPGATTTSPWDRAGFNLTTGNYNVALGRNAGFNLTTGSYNIIIGADISGNVSDANTIRIGNSNQKKTFKGGISGKTVPNGVGVIVNANGQLGTIVSSARFKEAIKPMGKSSEALLALKPVTFRYKEDLAPDGVPQFGLIAEQVEKVDPNLVIRDEDGKVNTVRYEAVNAMLLNEFLKEHRTVEELRANAAAQRARTEAQEVTLTKQQAIIAQQQKQIEALKVGLQKVNAQVALKKSSGRRIAND